MKNSERTYKLDLLGETTEANESSQVENIVIKIERRGRKSKTIVENLVLPAAEMTALVKLLRKKACCSCAFKNDVMTLHGDQRVLMMDHLTKEMGYTQDQITECGV